MTADAMAPPGAPENHHGAILDSGCRFLDEHHERDVHEDDLDVHEPHAEAEAVGTKHSLPVLKVTLPPDADADEDDKTWKLDRRDSGSLFWRRDSVACKTSRIKFRHHVDVREFQPRPEERLAVVQPEDADEEDEDIYSDDYILKHDMEAPSSWLRPSSYGPFRFRPKNLFGYRRLRLPRTAPLPGGSVVTGPDGVVTTVTAPPKESSVFMSLVCVVAILVTAWMQGSISLINL